MPRGQRIPRIGPFLENGSFRLPHPIEDKAEKKKRKEERRKEKRTLEAQEMVESQVLPRRLKRMSFSNSAVTNARQSAWLDQHPYVLMAFIQKLAKDELERQKELARHGSVCYYSLPGDIHATANGTDSEETRSD